VEADVKMKPEMGKGCIAASKVRFNPAFKRCWCFSGFRRRRVAENQNLRSKFTRESSLSNDTMTRRTDDPILKAAALRSSRENLSRRAVVCG
jgi:hypothetical protein